jgi:Putative Se/S carrier protein-like
MPYVVLLFDSVNAALLAEKILKEGGIPHKLIPVPKHLSSDCGVCIRIQAADKGRVEAALGKKLKIQSIQSLS